jgi:hypothetical protein
MCGGVCHIRTDRGARYGDAGGTRPLLVPAFPLERILPVVPIAM